MATNLSLITGTFEFGGSTAWTPAPLLPMYKGTAWRASRAQAPLVFSFQGTSVAFIGVLPPSTSQTPTVQIDNGNVSTIENRPSPAAYRQWFKSPRLSDGGHTIRVNCSEGTVLNYAVVDAGTQTSLTGQTALVDDDSPLILYSGYWSRNTSQFQSNIIGNGTAYGNSTHRCSTPGGVFTFRFTGISVSVYGIFSWLNLGFLAVTYTVDGTTVPQTYNVTSLERGNDEGESANFLYYSLDNLSPGDHTLIVNVTAANNQSFALDYITYIPSFGTLSSMPRLDPTPPTTSITSSSPTVTPSLVQTPSTPQPWQIKPLQTVAVVGGVIGVLALAVLVGAWLLLRQRKARQSESISQYLYYDNSNSPYTATATPPGKRERLLRPLGPEKYRRSNPEDHAGSHLPSSIDPLPNINYLPNDSANPPAYDAISIAL